MRYFRQWLDEDIQEINDINADLLRNYINYLMTERIPYAEDEQRKRNRKGLSVHTINIRIRGLCTFFRFLSTEGIIPANPKLRRDYVNYLMKRSNISESTLNYL